jgi:aminocarboxymuconate-semialdehyde decarboxylase
LRIDVHAHIVPKDLQAKAAERGQRVMGLPTPAGEPRMVTPPQQGDFRIDQIDDVPTRLADMQKQRIDMQVLSMPPSYFYRLPPDVAREMSRLVNASIANVVAENPERFIGIADVPLQSPEDAVIVLEEAVRGLGLRGVEIGSQIAGRNLDEKDFASFYRKVEELDVPIFIHPQSIPGMEERLARYYLVNLIGNPVDTSIGVASLIFGGVLKEFPRLKIYLAHGGGACPYIRFRWDHGWRVRSEGRVNIEKPPSEYFKQLYFDCLTHSPEALAFLVSSVGADKVMVGTDYPFDMGNYESVELVEGLAGISDADKALILGDTAARLFKL